MAGVEGGSLGAGRCRSPRAVPQRGRGCGVALARWEELWMRGDGVGSLGRLFLRWGQGSDLRFSPHWWSWALLVCRCDSRISAPQR